MITAKSPGFRSAPFLFIVFVVCFLPAFLFAQNLEIHHINVQQGTSILIIGPNGTKILFDGGRQGKGTDEVVPYLQSQGITTSTALDYMILSHRDFDHYAGLTEVINAGYDFLTVYDNGSDKTSTTIQDFLDAAATTSAGGVVPIPLGTVIDLGNGATATCVVVNGEVIGAGPISGALNNENDRSVGLLIEYGDFDFLACGDLGGGDEDNSCTGRSTGQVNVETPLVQSLMPGGAFPMLNSTGTEVHHVNHHGSESSTNWDVMNLLSPSVACISVGAGQGGTFHHPRQDVVENVLQSQASCISAPPALVLQTEEGDPTGSNTSFAGYCVGDIVITTDGVSDYTIDATGAVSQGPDERTAAGLPVTYNFDESTSDITPPVIANVHDENVGASIADIVWDTDEPANSVVHYGTAPGNYNDTASDGALVVSHRVTLTGLAATTTYYYIVESTDASNNTATSAEHSFTTTVGAPATVVISEVFYDTPGTDSKEEWIELYNTTGNTIDVSSWTLTDNNGTGSSFVLPNGSTIAAGTYFTVATHRKGFKDLYGYNPDVNGSIPALNNDGDALILADASSVTVDAVAWEGGASAGLPAGWGSATDPNAPTGNSIVRTDPNNDSDAYSDWSIAANNGNPQTQSMGAPDTTPPLISNVQSSSVTASSALITWDTDESSNSVVRYGTAPGTYPDSQSDGSLVTAHSVNLSGLQASTTYYYVVESTDAANNTATSAEFNFTTLEGGVDQPMVSVIDMSSNVTGPWTRAVANITVTSNGSPVSGTVVDVTWTGTVGSTSQGTTDSNGQVVLESDKTRENSWTFTATIDNIVLAGYFWDSANSEVSDNISSTAGPTIAGLSNFPNPFNPATTIRYELNKSSEVELTIFNIRGQRVRTLVHAEQQAGAYVMPWNGRDELGNQVASGVYWYRLRAGDLIQTRQMILTK